MSRAHGLSCIKRSSQSGFVHGLSPFAATVTETVLPSKSFRCAAAAVVVFLSYLMSGKLEHTGNWERRVVFQIYNYIAFVR